MQYVLVAVLVLAVLFGVWWVADNGEEALANLGKLSEEDKIAIVARESQNDPDWDPEYGNMQYDADGSYKDDNLNDELDGRQTNLWFIAFMCFIIILFCVSTGTPAGLLIALVLFIIGCIFGYAAMM